MFTTKVKDFFYKFCLYHNFQVTQTDEEYCPQIVIKHTFRVHIRIKEMGRNGTIFPYFFGKK